MADENKTTKIDENEMPFLEHLEELRWRLIKCIVSVFIGALIVFFFAPQILVLLGRPYYLVANENKFIFLEPMGGFMTHLEIALFGGIIFSLPVIFYQMWQFVAPGLFARERGWTIGIIIFSTVSFLIGSTFAYLVMIPLSLRFLMGYQSEMLVASLTIQKYMSFVLTMTFVAGMAFELPLVAFFLTKIGLLTPKFMREKRRYGIVGILILAAILTPPDPMSQLLMALPLVVLFEISILVSYLALKPPKKKKKKKQDDSDEPPDPAAGAAPQPTPPGDGGTDDTPTITGTDSHTSGIPKVESIKNETPGLTKTPESDTTNGKLLPDKYKSMSDSDLRQRIEQIKHQYGRRLIILGHHYQRDDIVELSDYTGDSFVLAKICAKLAEAEYIVFGGVTFMAESARILARPDQIVVHPDPDAGCPLADFAEINQVEAAWEVLGNIIGMDNLIPLTYMNSSSEIKAFCGYRRGTVCTSSNAPRAFKWAFEQGERLFFFPDENLGWNTAAQLAIPKDKIVTWDPNQVQGGLTRIEIEQARIFLWKGYCHVHTLFTEAHVEAMRRDYPKAAIIVHPECKPAVVKQSDAAGSTEFIINYATEAPTGGEIIIGTEINLVQRLAEKFPEKTILPLARSLCPNMYKINLNNLCWTLENLGRINLVTVPDKIAKPAKQALDRMLEIT